LTSEKVLTHNFATALPESTILNLSTLTTKLLLVSSFQNCELKQEAGGEKKKSGRGFHFTRGLHRHRYHCIALRAFMEAQPYKPSQHSKHFNPLNSLNPSQPSQPSQPSKPSKPFNPLNPLNRLNHLNPLNLLNLF